MGIDVAWVSESGEPKQQVFDPQQLLTRLATSTWPLQNGTVCLRFINPWGDTVFNQMQIPILLDELRSVLSVQRDREVHGHLVKVIRLVEQAAGQVHSYVKFNGD